VDRVEHHVDQAKDWAEGAKKQLYQANIYASKARKVRNKIQHFSLSLFLPPNVIDKPFEIINMNSFAHVVIHTISGVGGD
jgi:uncharacterized iron-regulated protein